MSGRSLALTQQTGGRITFLDGTQSLVQAIWKKAPYETRLSTRSPAVTQGDGRVEVHTRAGETIQARKVVVAVPLNALGGIEFDPAAFGDEARRRSTSARPRAASRSSSRARGAGFTNGIKPEHPFGYLDTEIIYPDETQLMIGFGYDQEICDASDLEAVQRQLDDIIPGYEAIARHAHDWLATSSRAARGRSTAGLVHDLPRGDAAARGQRPHRRKRLRERLGRVHGRGDRVGPQGGRVGSRAIERRSSPPSASCSCRSRPRTPTSSATSSTTTACTTSSAAGRVAPRAPRPLRPPRGRLAACGRDVAELGRAPALRLTGVGTVQATITAVEAKVARLGWMIGVEWQNQGFASEPATALVTWVRRQGVEDVAPTSIPTTTPRHGRDPSRAPSDRGRIRRRARLARVSEGGMHAWKV
jgi:hypothetical protein